MAEEPNWPDFGEPDEQTGPRPEIERQRQPIDIPEHKILLHNDDITPMDFVMQTLSRFFQMDEARAREVMMKAHHDGIAVVAVMPLERAEFKVERAHSYARDHGFPLTFTIEPC